MKNTFDLYRCSSMLWAKLPYEDALQLRKEKAKEAMDYYRIKATAITNKRNSEKYIKLVKLFAESEDAMRWNEVFIDEIITERRRLFVFKNKKDIKKEVPGKQGDSVCVNKNRSNECIFTDLWKWIKNNYLK